MRRVCAALFLPPVVSSGDFRLCLYYHGVCLSTDSLVLEPIDPVLVLPSETKVNLMVEVVMSSGAAPVYVVDVPKGSTLLEALEILKGKNVGFT